MFGYSRLLQGSAPRLSEGLLSGSIRVTYYGGYGIQVGTVACSARAFMGFCRTLRASLPAFTLWFEVQDAFKL